MRLIMSLCLLRLFFETVPRTTTTSASDTYPKTNRVHVPTSTLAFDSGGCPEGSSRGLCGGSIGIGGSLRRHRPRRRGRARAGPNDHPREGDSRQAGGAHGRPRGAFDRVRVVGVCLWVGDEELFCATIYGVSYLNFPSRSQERARAIPRSNFLLPVSASPSVFLLSLSLPRKPVSRERRPAKQTCKRPSGLAGPPRWTPRPRRSPAAT